VSVEDAFYRQLFEELPCYVSAQDRDLRIVAANRIFRRDFTPELGAFCYEIYKRRSEKCPECPVELSLRDGRIHRGEQVVTRRDGEEVAVIVYTAPIRNGSGEILAAVEVSANITEVKKLQERLRILFDETPCYISVQGRNLRIQEANRRFKTDFGEVIGEHCWDVYKHRSEPCLACPVAQAFHDGQVHQSEEVVTPLDGQPINVFCHAAPIRNTAGDITAVMEMSHDITELRQLQSKLTSLGMIVGSVSHGLKGLLSGLDGGVYLMETGFNKDEMKRVRQGWEMIQRNVDRIRSMVLNVLYYAKDREVFWQPIDLEELATSIEEVVSSRASALGVALEVAAEPGSFEGDHHAVHSMLVNLVENSIDACRLDKSKSEHRVAFTTSVESDQILFEVTDNGIGMDRETREKAFSLFFSSKGAEGTGLGLFIAHKIVRAHGGTIELDSSPGQGTRFGVRLPRVRPPAVTEDGATGSSEGGEG